MRRRRSIAALEGVALVSHGAAADWLLLAVDFALGVLSAHGSGWQHTGVLADMLETGVLASGAVFRRIALAAHAGDHCVANEAAGAGADGAFVALSVGAGVAVGTSSAGIVGAQVGVSEGAAGLEGMARHVLRAGADGLVVLYMAVGSGAASTDARV